MTCYLNEENPFSCYKITSKYHFGVYASMVFLSFVVQVKEIQRTQSSLNNVKCSV